ATPERDVPSDRRELLARVPAREPPGVGIALAVTEGDDGDAFGAGNDLDGRGPRDIGEHRATVAENDNARIARDVEMGPRAVGRVASGVRELEDRDLAREHTGARGVVGGAPPDAESRVERSRECGETMLAVECGTAHGNRGRGSAAGARER